MASNEQELSWLFYLFKDWPVILEIWITASVLPPFLARLHEVHRAIVVTSVVPIYVYVYVCVTLSVKVFLYKSISLDHVDVSS